MYVDKGDIKPPPMFCPKLHIVITAFCSLDDSVLAEIILLEVG